MKKSIAILCLAMLTALPALAQNGAPPAAASAVPVGVPTAPPPPPPSVSTNTCQSIGLGGEGKVFGSIAGDKVRWFRHEGCCLNQGAVPEDAKSIPALQSCEALRQQANVPAPPAAGAGAASPGLGVGQPGAPITFRDRDNLASQAAILTEQLAVLESQVEIQKVIQEAEAAGIFIPGVTANRPRPAAPAPGADASAATAAAASAKTPVEEEAAALNKWPAVVSIVIFGDNKQAELVIGTTRVVAREGDVMISGVQVKTIGRNFVQFELNGEKATVPVQGSAKLGNVKQ